MNLSAQILEVRCASKHVLVPQKEEEEKRKLFLLNFHNGYSLPQIQLSIYRKIMVVNQLTSMK